MHSFVLLAYASLAVSRTLLLRLLACLNVTLDSEDLFCWCKRKKKDFYDLWQQHKQLKTMEVRLDLIFTMRDTYINSNLNPLIKFPSSSRSTEFKDILPWNISQMINPNQCENSHKLNDEVGHPVLNLTESQWKLRQQHDQNFRMKGKPLWNKYQRQK